VYIAARDENRARKTIEELKEKTGKQSVFFLKLDLADLPSIKAAVEEFKGKETKLHTFYNNGLAVLFQVCMGERLTCDLTALSCSRPWMC
jgi:NADP-dependent 3-hydroxy acid dehydrogenase YdfG